MQRSQKLLKRRDNGSFLLQSVSKAAPTTTKTASDSELIRCKSNRLCLLFLKRPSNQVTQASIHLHVNASFAGSFIELDVIKAAIIYLTMLSAPADHLSAPTDHTSDPLLVAYLPPTCPHWLFSCLLICWSSTVSVVTHHLPAATDH